MFSHYESESLDSEEAQIANCNIPNGTTVYLLLIVTVPSGYGFSCKSLPAGVGRIIYTSCTNRKTLLTKYIQIGRSGDLIVHEYKRPQSG